MSIERINMGVPVAVPVADSAAKGQGLAAEVARESAELDGLIQEFTVLLAERGKLAWTRASKAQRRDKFDLRTKGLTKKFAGLVANLVDDRHARRRVRTRIYSDLIATLQSVATDCDVQHQRRLVIVRWLWLTSIALASAVTVVIYGAVLDFTVV